MILLSMIILVNLKIKSSKKIGEMWLKRMGNACKLEGIHAYKRKPIISLLIYKGNIMDHLAHNSLKSMELDHKDGDAHKLATKRLMNKVAVVTGGSRGIGGATAKLLAEHGAHVIIADVLDELGTSLANSINGLFVHCDVSVESDVEVAIQLAITWKGKLDILFNNAGIGDIGGSITTLDMKRVSKLVEVNINGVVHGIKHAARAMILGGQGGSIISSSSTAAIMGGLGSHAYTLTKEAILGLTRSSSCELGTYGIRVNCVLPHAVLSDMLVDAYRGFKQDVTTEEIQQTVSENASLLRGRCGMVEDVAEAVLFLASEQSGFITGHNLVIGGGYTSSINMTFIYREKKS